MPPRSTRLWSVSLTALLATACASTAPPAVVDAGADSAARPCSDDNQCNANETCSAGYCRPAGPADAGPDRPAVPTMVVSPLLLDFGNPLVGGEYARTFTITNAGGASLTVATVNLIEDHTTGAFTVVHDPLPLAIEPDASVTVTVVLRPNDAVLPTGTIKIHGNDPDPASADATIDLVAREKGAPELGVCVLATAPPPDCAVSGDGNPVIDYGVVDYGASADRVVGLTNQGDGNLPIKVTEISLTDPTHFGVTLAALVDDPANPGQKIEQATALPFLLGIADPSATPPVPATELRAYVRFAAQGIHGDVPHVSLVVKYNLAGSPTTVPVVGRISGCAPGTDAGVPDGGTDLLTDPSNCGSCDHVCATANGTPACAAGTCVTGSCNAGYGDCDANPANGCETALAGVTYCGLCATDSQCQLLPGFFCNGVQCEKKRPPGTGCGVAKECLSGFCVDGVCCASVCSGPCRTCAAAGTEGTCTNYQSQTDPENECGACRVCSGSGACTSATAGSDPKDNCAQEAAATCGRDGACDGAGGCRKWASSTVCAPQTCSGSTKYPADTCDGSGSCVDSGAVSCAPYACLGNDCRQDCSQHTDCSTGSYCNASGACVAKQDLGASCTDGIQCLLGKCVDNVCCNSDCAGTCEACNLGGKLGTCSAIAGDTDPDRECGLCRVCNGARGCKDAVDGTDPKLECDPEAQSSCGRDGECRAGACRKWVSGTVCAPQACASNVQQNADTCDGNGVCTDGGATPCVGYICEGTACRTSCTGDGHCQAGYQCLGSKCRRWETVLSEDFDPCPTTGWMVFNNNYLGGRTPWYCVTGGANQAGGTGNYAIADSDGQFGGIRTGLITPPLDLSPFIEARISYQHDYQDFNASDYARLEYSFTSSDGPWTTIKTYTSDYTQVPELLDVSVTAGHGTVWFRFWYDDGNTWALWWALDNVLVEAR